MDVCVAAVQQVRFDETKSNEMKMAKSRMIEKGKQQHPSVQRRRIETVNGAG